MPRMRYEDEEELTPAQKALSGQPPAPAPAPAPSQIRLGVMPPTSTPPAASLPTTPKKEPLPPASPLAQALGEPVSPSLQTKPRATGQLDIPDEPMQRQLLPVANAPAVSTTPSAPERRRQLSREMVEEGGGAEPPPTASSAPTTTTPGAPAPQTQPRATGQQDIGEEPTMRREAPPIPVSPPAPAVTAPEPGKMYTQPAPPAPAAPVAPAPPPLPAPARPPGVGQLEITDPKSPQSAPAPAPLAPVAPAAPTPPATWNEVKAKVMADEAPTPPAPAAQSPVPPPAPTAGPATVPGQSGGYSFDITNARGETTTVVADTPQEKMLIDIAREAGIDPATVGLGDLVRNGMSAQDANAAIASIGNKAINTLPNHAPVRDASKETAPVGAPSPLPQDLQSALDKANTAIASGDTKAAVDAILEASKTGGNPGITPVQAHENVTAQQENRPPINTADPSGLWDGTVSEGNPSGAPTEVIKSTATAEQVQRAKEQYAKSLAAAKAAGYSSEPAIPPFSATPGTGGTTAPPAALPEVSAYSAEKYKAPVAGAAAALQPAPQTVEKDFKYSPAAYALDPDKAQTLASQRAGLAIDPRLASINKEYGRQELDIAERERMIPTALAKALAANDEEASRAGFYTSGRRFALRGGSYEQAQADVGQLARMRTLAGRERGDAVIAAESERGMLTASEVDRLQRDDRDAQFRERGQQFGEFSDSRNYARNALESDRQYDMARGAFEDQYKPGGLGYAARALDNATKEAGFNDTYTQGGLGYQSRAAGLQGQKLENEGRLTENQGRVLENRARELQNEAAASQNTIAKLEAEIAASTDVGRKAQLKSQLETAESQRNLIQSQILENQAQAAKQGDSGLTAYQQYQIDRDAQQDAKKEASNVTAATVAQRWGISNPGLTTNYGALDTVVSGISAEILGSGATYADVEAYVTQNAKTLTANGVDPSAILGWAKGKLQGGPQRQQPDPKDILGEYLLK